MSSAATAINILELREMDYLNLGDVLGYYAHGHLDQQRFADAVNAEYEPDRNFNPNDVQYLNWIKRPLEPEDSDCDGFYVELCTAGDVGAISVTYLEV